MKTRPKLKTSALLRGMMLGVHCVALLSWASTSEAELIGRYELNNTNLEDSAPLGRNEPIEVVTAANLGATGYTFSANAGLQVKSMLFNASDDASTIDDYSLLIDFSLSDVTGLNKIIDFKDRGTDASGLDSGIYVHKDGSAPSILKFFFAAGLVETLPRYAFNVNELVRLVITRDGGSNAFNAYINGDHEFSFVDDAASSNPDRAVFTGTNGIIHFFKDDFTGGSTESAEGFVDRIEIYDEALTAAQVAALNGPAAVPEPSTIALSLVGLGTFFFARRRRSKVLRTEY